MRTPHLLAVRSSLLLTSLALAERAHAQAHASVPACTVSAGELRDMVLPDSTYAIIFPVEMIARRDSILILGANGLTDDRGNPIYRAGDDSILVGFMLTNKRRTVTAIPAPRGLPTARYFRSRVGDRGWEAVFFVPDRDAMHGERRLDDGTLWYARLQSGRWTDLERVGRVEATTVLRPNSSDLVMQNGTLRFAVYYGDVPAPGGVIVWRREHARRWFADTLPLNSAPLTVSTPRDDASSRVARFYAVANFSQHGDFIPSALLAVASDRPSEWTVVRRPGSESMNEPVEHVVRDTTHVSWWSFQRGAPSAVWYQALDPRHENPASAQRLVVSGVNEFNFLAVPEGRRTRLVWAYRPPSTIDSAQVAVVANGEPVVVGQVAFPFGFMTNGVASGDRSFILATTPRPVPDGEPSASRTLEVRVTCRGRT